MRVPQFTAVLLLVATLPAMAQTAPTSPDASPQQHSFGHGHKGHGPMGALRQLNLSDTQKQQVSQLMQSVKTQNASLFEQQRTLREQMRAADEAGDEAKFFSIRSQMDALRPQLKAVHTQTEQGINQILTPEQASKLAQIKAAQKTRRSLPPTQ